MFLIKIKQLGLLPDDENISDSIAYFTRAYRVSQKICYNPGKSTLLFRPLFLFFPVSDKPTNKCSKDSFIQVYN